jgi:hypothetical protein
MRPMDPEKASSVVRSHRATSNSLKTTHWDYECDNYYISYLPIVEMISIVVYSVRHAIHIWLAFKACKCSWSRLASASKWLVTSPIATIIWSAEFGVRDCHMNSWKYHKILSWSSPLLSSGEYQNVEVNTIPSRSKSSQFARRSYVFCP